MINKNYFTYCCWWTNVSVVAFHLPTDWNWKRLCRRPFPPPSPSVCSERIDLSESRNHTQFCSCRLRNVTRQQDMATCLLVLQNSSLSFHSLWWIIFEDVFSSDKLVEARFWSDQRGEMTTSGAKNIEKIPNYWFSPRDSREQQGGVWVRGGCAAEPSCFPHLLPGTCSSSPGSTWVEAPLLPCSAAQTSAGQADKWWGCVIANASQPAGAKWWFCKYKCLFGETRYFSHFLHEIPFLRCTWALPRWTDAKVTEREENTSHACSPELITSWVAPIWWHLNLSGCKSDRGLV